MRMLELATSDGTAGATLHGEAATARAGVVLYMDAFGPRPALHGMAERLAGEGYAVLVPDLFYRYGRYGPFDARTAFAQEETATKLRGMIAGTSQAMTIRDGAAFLAALEAAGTKGPAMTVGYCMGGGRAVNAAAAYPDRVVAAASFHGGHLAADTDDSPAANAPRLRARVYVGTAGVDASFPPEQSARLVSAFREAEVDFMLENYVGLRHGWCVPDHSVYDAEGAERAWRQLLRFFDDALGR